MLVATATKQWTLQELHSLPDDGNKYELLRGELLVTPPPTDDHETIAARLTRLLDPFVARHKLGFVYHPRAVYRKEGSELEPDLMVRQPQPDRKAKWNTAPLPVLVVEIISPYTGRRDRTIKRDFYMETGIPEYWIVDGEREMVTVVRPGHDDAVERERLIWRPAAVSEGLVVDVESMFR